MTPCLLSTDEPSHGLSRECRDGPPFTKETHRGYARHNTDVEVWVCVSIEREDTWN